MQISEDASSPEGSTSSFIHRDTWIAAAVVAMIAAIALAQSWGRWLDPVIDAGRDLYIPEQIRGGTKLYRDILYFYPPLAPYALALVTAVTGSGLAAYTAIGLATALVTVVALFVLVRSVASTTAAGVAAALFAALSLAGASSWGCNFVFPYAHAATIGMSLTTLFAAALAVFLFRGQSPRWLAIALIAGFLASWSKIELAFLVTVVVVIVWVAHRLPWKPLAVYAAASVASVVAVSIVFRDAPAGSHWLRDNVLAPSLLRGDSAAFFYSHVSGLAQWREALPEIVRSAALTLAFIGALALLERLRDRRGARLALLLVLALLTVTAAGEGFFRGWALLQIALVPFAVTSDRRRPLLLLLAVSLLATWRIALNTAPEWYGFVLTVPTYALIAYVLLEWLPGRAIYSRRAALLWLPTLVLTAAFGLHEQRLAWSAKRYPIATVRGTLHDHNPARAAALQQLLAHLKARPASGLVAIPEGLTINYFTGVENPSRFQTFTPVEAAAPAFEQRIIADFDRTRPETVVILPRDVREFGYTAWGVDYHTELRRYLEAHYTLERRWTDPQFPMLLLRRR